MMDSSYHTKPNLTMGYAGGVIMLPNLLQTWKDIMALLGQTIGVHVDIYKPTIVKCYTVLARPTQVTC